MRPLGKKIKIKTDKNIEKYEPGDYFINKSFGTFSKCQTKI